MTARVFHKDLWGTREAKYAWLAENEVSTTAWTELAPQTPFYLFTPHETDAEPEYKGFVGVNNILLNKSSGFQTKRDNVAVAASKDQLVSTLKDFANSDIEVLRGKYNLPADGRDWKVEWAVGHARDLVNQEESWVQCLYRPFDLRWTVLDNRSKGFVAYPRYEVMRQLRHTNLGLVLTRQLSLQSFQHAWATRHPIDVNSISLQTREYNYLFPLYLYPSEQEIASGLYAPAERRPNLSPDFVKDLEQRIGLTFVSDGRGDLATTFGPEDVFHYVYAVLHSPTYRERYAEFLKIDFPRIPLTTDAGLFRELVGRGADLTALHLMESPALSQTITSYPVKGDNLMEPGHPRYRALGEPEPGTGKPLAQGRLYISKDDPKTGKRGQYAEGVPKDVWEFQVGGYQVCDKWLKDRRGRTLTDAGLTRYDKIVVALKETIRLMAEIDQAIDACGGWPLAGIK
jgi:predicted helicase